MKINISIKMNFSLFPPPLTHKKHGGERDALLNAADDYLLPVDETIAVSDKQRQFLPGFNTADTTAEIDRMVEVRSMSPDDARELIDRLATARTNGEAEDILALESLKHPRVA